MRWFILPLILSLVFIVGTRWVSADCSPGSTTGDDSITCTGIDAIEVSGDTGNDTITIQTGAFISGNVIGDAGNDIITNSGFTAYSISGDAGDDRIENTSSAITNVIVGGADNDSVL